jgi:hypothetical protein
MREYKIVTVGLPIAVMQSATLYEKLDTVARGEHMPLSIAAGMVAEMRRKVASDWWGQPAPQRAECPYYTVEDLESVQDLLTAARITDEAIVEGIGDVNALSGIRKGIELSSAWVQNVAVTERRGEKFCAACGEYVYDYMTECPCGARGIFYTGDFC